MEIEIDFKAQGYVEIPGYSRYLINREGVVFNKETGSLRRGRIGLNGYLQISVKRDDGRPHSPGVHRLLGLAFIHPEVDVSNLVINHLDGVKTNNDLSNLEWTTHQLNLYHAGEMGLNKCCRPVEVRNAETGMVKRYPSGRACARDRGLTRDDVNRRLKFPESRIWSDRCQYRWAVKDKEWIIPDDIELEVLKNGTKKSIAVRHLLENKIYIFESLSGAADHLKIAPPTLSMRLDLPGQPVFPGYVQLKLLTDPTPWREVKDPYLEYSNNRLHRVIKVTDQDGNVKLYDSAADCARDNGLLTTTLNERLNSNGTKVYKDGKRYCRYEDSV